MVSFILATLVSTAPLDTIRDKDHVVTNVNLTEIQKGFEELPKQYRRIGDDQAYAVKSVGEFVTWSCPDHPELAQAMQGRQPGYYDYGDGTGKYYINLEVNGRYWYGWAYADLNADTVVFSVYCDYWDEEVGDYYYDWVEITGKRGVAEYDLEHPVDRFATKGEVFESVGSVRDGVNHLTGLLTSETKLWRTGKPNECGYGWGYMQHNLTNDLRRWRIRVPKVTEPAAFHLDSTKTTKLIPAPEAVPDLGFTLYDQYKNDRGIRNVFVYYIRDSMLLANRSDWRWDFRPIFTRGTQGSDAVVEVDYLLELPWVTFTMTCDSITNNKPVYTTRLTSSNPAITIKDLGDRYALDLPASAQITSEDFSALPCVGSLHGYMTNKTMSLISDSGFYIYYTNYLHSLTIKGVQVMKDPVQGSAGTLRVPMYVSGEYVLRYDLHMRPYGAYDTGVRPVWSGEVTNSTAVFSLDMFDLTVGNVGTLMDVYSQAYRLMGTYDSNLFYDSALDCTFRIVSSNGVFYTEVHHDGDWREKAWR